MSKGKIALIVCGGLVVLLMFAGSFTPKTVNQFVNNYNREIKDTAGSRDVSVAQCSLYTFDDYGIAKGSLFNGKVVFEGTDHNQSFSVVFIFNEDLSPHVVFAMIEAAIAASGEDYQKVCRALDILSDSEYKIRGGQRSKTRSNGKEYSLVWTEDSIFFRIDIPKK